PNFKPSSNYFGIFIPMGVPDEVVATLDQIWKERIANSEALKKYAANRGAVFTPYYGQEAMVRAVPYITFAAWLYYDAGKAKISPDQAGIPRPE
ncbi:MAG: hypothetical protein L0Y56_04730, partial [Nitrospira sp.]|nr:hypothetical protein [Nitrospira sp.]